MRRTTCLLATAALLACSDAPPTGLTEVEGEAAARRIGQTLEAHNFVAPLSGRYERPPVPTRAHGVATFKLSEDETELHYRLIVANIEDITQAHIHIGTATQNGPFVVFLFGLATTPVTENGLLAEGTITEADLIPREGFDATMEELVARMRAGATYVNVHTSDNPAGEIRGQINPAGPVR